MSLVQTQLKQWLKSSENPVAKTLFASAKAIILAEIPAPKIVFKPLYTGYNTGLVIIQTLARVLWWSPLFKSQTHTCGKALYLYGGLPYLAGPLQISIGDRCRISGKTTLTGRACALTTPELTIGSNVDIGWQCTLAVGTRITLGNNVRIAGQCFLAGYPGHPLNAKQRAEGLAEHHHQARDIILENDVWLGTGVTVMAGVRIGEGTVVAAGRWWLPPTRQQYCRR